MTAIKTSRRVETSPALEWALEFLPHYLTEAPCGFHAELMGDLENADKRLIARVAPRGHGKSVIACLAYPLWCICEHRRPRKVREGIHAPAYRARNIVIVTHEQGLATGFVRDLRSELENNPLILSAYGDLCDAREGAGASSECRVQGNELEKSSEGRVQDEEGSGGRVQRNELGENAERGTVNAEGEGTGIGRMGRMVEAESRSSGDRPEAGPPPFKPPLTGCKPVPQIPVPQGRSRTKWTEEKFTTTTGITVQAKGVGASLRGARVGAHRPDLIICDDIEKDEHVETPEGRMKVEAWVRHVAMPALAPQGRLLVLGSLLHYDSLLASLADRRRWPRWDYRVYRALEGSVNASSEFRVQGNELGESSEGRVQGNELRTERDGSPGGSGCERESRTSLGCETLDTDEGVKGRPESRSSLGCETLDTDEGVKGRPESRTSTYTGGTPVPDGITTGCKPVPQAKRELCTTADTGVGRYTALWPERWPVERLEEERERIGTRAFEQEYQGRPVDDTTRVFRPEWLRSWEPHELEPERCTTVMAVDPATGASSGDYFALWVGSIDRTTGVIFTRELTIDRIGIVEQVRRIVSAHERWKPAKIGIETTAYQAALKQVLDELSRREARYMRTVAIGSTSSKQARIQAASVFFENGTFRLPPALDPVIEAQFLHFPKTTHDDGPDVCAMGIELARAAGWAGRIEGAVASPRRYEW